MSNIIPINSGKPNAAVSIRIERQRIRLFRAINFVYVTKHTLDQDDFIQERDVLSAALELMNDIAFELNTISGHNDPLPEDLDPTDQPS